MQQPLPFRLLPTHPTDWDPAAAKVTLNVRLAGAIVPSAAAAEGARVAYSHAVVLDELVGEQERGELLHFLTGAGSMGAGAALPADRWERRTADIAGGAPTWGVRQQVLQQLALGELPALREVHARLCKLYPECDIAHLPSDAIQGEQGQPALVPGSPRPSGNGVRPAASACGPLPLLPQQQQQQEEEEEGPQGQGRPSKRSRPGPAQAEWEEEKEQSVLQLQEPEEQRVETVADAGSQQQEQQPQQEQGEAGECSPAGGVDCNAFVANAAVQGDNFRYHVDADPTSFPDDSAWVGAYGDYFNGEPGRPLLVSLLLYLNESWERDWGADTLLLDDTTDTGVYVVPKPGRAILLDQDILHRVSPPSAAAGGRPRFSLVWKLALLPRHPAQRLCLARPEWAPPTSFGSAARVEAVKRQLAAERRQQQLAAATAAAAATAEAGEAAAAAAAEAGEAGAAEAGPTRQQRDGEDGP